MTAELTMKAWVIEEAVRHNVTPSAIKQRKSRGKYDDRVTFRYVNKRVVFVRAKAPTQ